MKQGIDLKSFTPNLPASRAVMGEPPEARVPEDQQADQPGATATAEDGEQPPRGLNIALHVGRDLGYSDRI